MTPEKLAELEALEAAATPGPDAYNEWYAEDDELAAALRNNARDLFAALREAWRERDEARAEVVRLRAVIRGALTNGHMNTLCWAQNDDECVGRCRLLREALNEEITNGMVE
jgi:hypothetical protein